VRSGCYCRGHRLRIDCAYADADASNAASYQQRLGCAVLKDRDGSGNPSPASDLITNNCPALSFFVVGLAALATGGIIFAGRISCARSKLAGSSQVGASAESTGASTECATLIGLFFTCTII
jgi:hypothetical protein